MWGYVIQWNICLIKTLEEIDNYFVCVHVCVCCPLQVKTEISVESKHQTLQGLVFPLQETAKRALQQLSQKRINYIQLVSRRGLVQEYENELPRKKASGIFPV